MKTITGNKKNIKKEFLKFYNDLNFIKTFLASKEYFANLYIENEIRKNGLYCNKNLKTRNLIEIEKEIISIL